MNARKITSEELLKLPIGSKSTLKCMDAKQCESVATLCYRIPKRYESHRDRRYKCSIDYIRAEVQVEVVPVNLN